MICCFMQCYGSWSAAAAAFAAASASGHAAAAAAAAPFNSRRIATHC
jgi:hypothetical protein